MFLFFIVVVVVVVVLVVVCRHASVASKLADVEFDFEEYGACAATTVSLLCSASACLNDNDNLNVERHTDRLLTIANSHLKNDFEVFIFYYYYYL